MIYDLVPDIDFGYDVNRIPGAPFVEAVYNMSCSLVFVFLSANYDFSSAFTTISLQFILDMLK